MESEVNIPARALLKPCVRRTEMTSMPVEPRQEVTERSGAGLRVSRREKFVVYCPRHPVPQTDTGGWVEYTKAKE